MATKINEVNEHNLNKSRQCVH